MNRLFYKQGTGIRLALILGLIGFVVLAGWLIAGQRTRIYSNKLSNITVALPIQISTGAFYVGLDQGIFNKHGVNVTTQPFILGKDALQSVLLGKADLAVVADVPFMFSVMRGEKIAAVTTVFGSRRTMAVVGSKDRGIAKAGDLHHKTIGTIFGTNSQYFLDTLLLVNGVAKSDVVIVDLKAGTNIDALQSGKVDAATIWHPDLARVQKAMGDRAVTIYGEDIFVYRFLLVGRQDYLRQHAAEVAQLLSGLNESTEFIHGQPAQAQNLIGKFVHIDPALLKTALYPNDYYLSLDQTLLLSLGDETRWAMKQGIVPTGPVPNYLNYIMQAPLKSVLPSAVRIIQ